MVLGDKALSNSAVWTTPQAALLQVQPVRHRGIAVERDRCVERMVECIGAGVAAGAPADEAHAVLERRVGVLEQRAFRNVEQPHRVTQRRHGGLAHADDADLGRFDQRDRDWKFGVGAQGALQVGGGQPAGGAAADDHDGTVWEHANPGKEG
jgi:hypothetical protein